MSSTPAAEPRVAIGLRVPLSTWKELQAMADARTQGVRTVTGAASACLRTGLEAIRHAEAMRDPARAAEFREQMVRVVQSGRITEWAAAMPTSQLEGFCELLAMEREGRYRQEAFR